MENIKRVTPTGIGEDYRKNFGPLNLLLRAIYGNTETSRIRGFATERFTKHGHKFYTYEEWFPKSEFSEVITDQNRSVIQRLDEIVKELNAMIDQGKITEVAINHSQHRALTLYNEALTLIMGWKDFDFREVLRKGEINKYFST